MSRRQGLIDLVRPASVSCASRLATQCAREPSTRTHGRSATCQGCPTALRADSDPDGPAWTEEWRTFGRASPATWGESSGWGECGWGESRHIWQGESRHRRFSREVQVRASKAVRPVLLLAKHRASHRRFIYKPEKLRTLKAYEGLRPKKLWKASTATAAGSVALARSGCIFWFVCGTHKQ